MINSSELLSAITPPEFADFQALAWQPVVALPGDFVFAQMSENVGLIALTGAMPFTETRKLSPDAQTGDNWVMLNTESVAQYLMRNPALRRSYRRALHQSGSAAISLSEPARIIQVSAEIAGLEAANFAIFCACQAASFGGRTLLLETDPKNQFVFPLLPLAETPKILTENLQKPATFKADLAGCLVKLSKNLSYLNVHASSLRPFDSEELASIITLLDADFDTIICYSGRSSTSWLSRNATTNYAIVNPAFSSESAALRRHAGGMHTVLIGRGDKSLLPTLGREFSAKQPLDFWTNETSLKNLKNQFGRHFLAKNMILGSHESSASNLGVHVGIDLYSRYAESVDNDFPSVIKTLQKKLHAVYPRRSFFSTRSILKHIDNLNVLPLTTAVEINGMPQLLSWPHSAELRATAIFPAGVLEPRDVQGMRINPLTSRGHVRLKTLLNRIGLEGVVVGPKSTRLAPTALGAVLEQMLP